MKQVYADAPTTPTGKYVLAEKLKRLAEFFNEPDCDFVAACSVAVPQLIAEVRKWREIADQRNWEEHRHP